MYHRYHPATPLLGITPLEAVQFVTEKEGVVGVKVSPPPAGLKPDVSPQLRETTPDGRWGG